MSIHITRELYEKSPGPSKCVSRRQCYFDKYLQRIETRTITSESDFYNEFYVRYSDDGKVFYSPATISHTIRSSKTCRAYWFGNITGPAAYGNMPRYPLVMAEVDETTGFLKKDGYTVIDDRDPVAVGRLPLFDRA